MDWHQVLLAISAGLIALIAAVLFGFRTVVVAYFERWTEMVKKRQYSHGLQKLANFYFAFDELCGLQSVERYMLMEGKDSGGLPQPGKPYTIRCLRGDTKLAEKHNPFNLYGFDMQIDSHYVDMLNHIVQNGYILFKTDEMDDCLLKSFYTSEGVSNSYVAYVGIVEARLIYISLAKYSGEFSKSDIVAMQLGIAKLRSRLDS